jgi:imidazolonepropionase-like amidohydrolase
MVATVLVCGSIFDGISDKLTGPVEISVEGNQIASIEQSVKRPRGAQIIDLSDRRVSPGFIDTHVHLTMDAANLTANAGIISYQSIKGPESRPGVQLFSDSNQSGHQ